MRKAYEAISKVENDLDRQLFERIFNILEILYAKIKGVLVY